MAITRRSNRRSALAALLLTAGVLSVAAGCSTDDIADKVAEKAAEASSGEDTNVDIDSETGEIKVETDDGTFEASSGTSELPDDWPSEVPLPDDYTLTGSTSFSSDDGTTFTVGGEVDDGTATFAEVTEAFVDGGWTETQKSTGNMGEGTSSSAMYENSTLQVMFSAMSLDDGTNTFGYTVMPATR